MSGETKRAPVIAASKPKDEIKMYFNPESFDGDQKQRVLEYLNQILTVENKKGDTFLQKKFDKAGSGIREATTTKIDGLGVCYGILTRGWLDVDRTSSEDIILIVKTPLSPPRHGSLSFSAFAAIKIIVEPSGTYLYLDGLCSHRGKAGLVMDYMLKTIGKPLFDAGLIQGFKLSALGYVIGYYYKKYGYKFYDTKSDQLVENKDLNSELKKFTNYVFTSDGEDVMPEDFIDTEEMSNWYEGMRHVLSEENYKGVVKRKELKTLGILAKDLEAQQKNPNRRETLTARLEIVRQIQTLMDKVEEQIKDAELENITPVMDFFLKVKNYSANPGRIMDRGRKKEEMAQQAVRQDLSSDGFYMYYIPERRVDIPEEVPMQIIPGTTKGRPTIPKGKRRPRTKIGGRKKRKRKKTRRKFRKKSKKRKKTRRRRKVKKTRRKRKR